MSSEIQNVPWRPYPKGLRNRERLFWVLMIFSFALTFGGFLLDPKGKGPFHTFFLAGTGLNLLLTLWKIWLDRLPKDISDAAPHDAVEASIIIDQSGLTTGNDRGKVWVEEGVVYFHGICSDAVVTAGDFSVETPRKLQRRFRNSSGQLEVLLWIPQTGWSSAEQAEQMLSGFGGGSTNLSSRLPLDLKRQDSPWISASVSALLILLLTGAFATLAVSSPYLLTQMILWLVVPLGIWCEFAFLRSVLRRRHAINAFVAERATNKPRESSVL